MIIRPGGFTAPTACGCVFQTELYSGFVVTAKRSGRSLAATVHLTRLGAIMAEGQIPGAEKKVVAGILAILLGWLGIHKFYLGYKTEGIIMVLVSVLSCFILAGVMSIIGIIEGIMYLTKSDEEFVETYINGQKGWF